MSYKENHFLDREFPHYYTHYMVAVTNNCEAFTEFALNLQVRASYCLSCFIVRPLSFL